MNKNSKKDSSHDEESTTSSVSLSDDDRSSMSSMRSGIANELCCQVQHPSVQKEIMDKMTRKEKYLHLVNEATKGTSETFVHLENAYRCIHYVDCPSTEAVWNRLHPQLTEMKNFGLIEVGALIAKLLQMDPDKASVCLETYKIIKPYINPRRTPTERDPNKPVQLADELQDIMRTYKSHMEELSNISLKIQEASSAAAMFEEKVNSMMEVARKMGNVKLDDTPRPKNH